MPLGGCPHEVSGASLVCGLEEKGENALGSSAVLLGAPQWPRPCLVVIVSEAMPFSPEAPVRYSGIT